MMNPVIASLVEETRSQDFETAADAIASIALLLERAAMSREADASYESMLPESLYKHQLSPDEFDALTLTVIEILKNDSRFTGSAAWALGKTYSARVAPELLAALGNWQDHDDLIVFNLLIALENCSGLESGRGLIEEISQVGGDKPMSMKFARRVIARTDASQ